MIVLDSNNMKTNFLRHAMCVLLMGVMITLGGNAQSKSVQTNGSYDCKKQPLGLFRQITGASIELFDGSDIDFVFDKESDIRENRWALAVLDEVDAAYKFYLIRNPLLAGKEKCGATMAVVGKLISPTGKLFDLKQATYDIPSRKLSFTTIERDGITYEAKVQFYAKPVLVGKMYQDGTVNLKASGRTLGIVLLHFPFTSWNSE